jgi:hypothetical protein
MGAEFAHWRTHTHSETPSQRSKIIVTFAGVDQWGLSSCARRVAFKSATPLGRLCIPEQKVVPHIVDITQP